MKPKAFVFDAYGTLFDVHSIAAKPSPRGYALAARVLNIPHEEILFVSSNSWDAAGAKAFGYKVCSCNRSQGSMATQG